VNTPAVRSGNQISGGQQSVEQIQTSCFLARDKSLAFTLLPAVTVCGGRRSLQSGKEETRSMNYCFKP